MNSKRIKQIIYFVISVFIFSFIASCDKDPVVSKSSFAFDTVITISIYDSSIKKDEKYALIDDAIRMCGDIEDKYSATKETSEIYLYNHFDAPLSADARKLLDKTEYFYKLSDGLFDCSIGSLIDLWNVKERRAVPSLEEISSAMNSEKKYLNFGAVIKGYASDKIKSYFLTKGVKSAIVNLGGNIICIGGKGGLSGFSIGIEEPFRKNSVIKVLDIIDRSVVTSGIYQRYFKEGNDDKIYSHIINPKTGYPVDNDLYSVTVVSDSSLLGDMLSTTILLMNPSRERLLEIIKKINSDFGDSVSIILVNNKYEVIEIDADSAL